MCGYSDVRQRLDGSYYCTVCGKELGTDFDERLAATHGTRWRQVRETQQTTPDHLIHPNGGLAPHDLGRIVRELQEMCAPKDLSHLTYHGPLETLAYRNGWDDAMTHIRTSLKASEHTIPETPIRKCSSCDHSVVEPEPTFCPHCACGFGGRFHVVTVPEAVSVHPLGSSPNGSGE